MLHVRWICPSSPALRRREFVIVLAILFLVSPSSQDRKKGGQYVSFQYLVVAALAVGFLTLCRSVFYAESEKGVGVYALIVGLRCF